MDHILTHINWFSIGGATILSIFTLIYAITHRSNKKLLPFFRIYALISAYSLCLLLFFEVSNPIIRSIFYHLRLFLMYATLYAYIQFAQLNWAKKNASILKFSQYVFFIAIIATFIEVDLLKDINISHIALQMPTTFYLFIALLYIILIYYMSILAFRLKKKEIASKIFLPFLLGGIIIALAGAIDIYQMLKSNNPADWDLLYPLGCFISGIIYMFSFVNLLLGEELDAEKLSVMEKESALLGDFQKKLLPPHDYQYKEIEASTTNIPAKLVSGDFYDIIEKLDEYVYIIGDVSGKSLPASFYMYICFSTLHSLVVANTQPKKIIELANDFFCEKFTRSMFLTMTIIFHKTKTHNLQIFSGGHPPVIIYSAHKKQVRRHKPKGRPMGIIEDAYFEHLNVKFKKDDIMLMFTDGITEAFNNEMEDFGMTRLEKLFKANCHLKADEIKNKILLAVNRFSPNNTHHDDITIMVIKCK